MYMFPKSYNIIYKFEVSFPKGTSSTQDVEDGTGHTYLSEPSSFCSGWCWLGPSGWSRTAFRHPCDPRLLQLKKTPSTLVLGLPFGIADLRHAPRIVFW